MQINLLEASQKERWNAVVAKEPFFAMTQSWEWGEFKEKFGWKVFRVSVEEGGEITAGAQLLVKPLPFSMGSVAYVPRGPFGNWLDNKTAGELFSNLHKIARIYRAIYLKIEPPLLNDLNIDKVLKLHNFRPSSQTNQPRATILINLTDDLDTIFQRMSKSTKRYVKHSEKQGVQVRVGGYEDFVTFYGLMQITGRRGQFSTRIPEYYVQEWKTFSKNNQALMLIAYYQDKVLAIHITYKFGDHAAYFHGASTVEHSDLHSNKLLIWESIKWAKERGCRTYDLWGIPDEVGLAVYEGESLPSPERTDGLWGVYRFKSGFSKNVQYFMGAYDCVYLSLPYMLITNRFLNSEKFERALALLDHHRNHKK